MSVVDVKERYALAKAEVQGLRDKLRAKRAERLDTDGESSSSHSCHLAMFSLPIYIIDDPTMERERESPLFLSSHKRQNLHSLCFNKLETWNCGIRGYWCEVLHHRHHHLRHTKIGWVRVGHVCQLE